MAGQRLFAGSTASFLTCILLSLVSTSLAQDSCYYPNGDTSPVDVPCPNSDLCCPFNWQCLDNGLCWDEASDQYDRRTCADQTWQSEDCPDFCLYSEAGNEAILQCRDGRYCCDGDGQFGCCAPGQLPDGTSFFDLPDGVSFGTITVQPGSGSSETDSSTSSPSRSTVATKSTRPSTTPSDTSQSSSSSVRSSTLTTEKSPSETGTSRTDTTPSSTSRSSSPAETGAQQEGDQQEDNSDPKPPSGSSGPNTALIGGIVGGVGGVLLLIALFFCIRRQRKKRRFGPSRKHRFAKPDDSPQMMNYGDSLSPRPYATEADSSPIVKHDRTSELQGSDRYNDKDSPGLSSVSGGWGTNGSPKSVVSPVMQRDGNQWSGPPPAQMRQIPEDRAAELEAGPVYRPYRPGAEKGPGEQTRKGPGDGSVLYEGT